MADHSQPLLSPSSHHTIQSQSTTGTLNPSLKSAHSIYSTTRSSRSTPISAHHLSVGSSDPTRAPSTQPIAGDPKADPLALHILSDDEQKNNLPTKPDLVNDETTGSTFDDLEFLHDFLEHEAQIGFFEANCFKCSARNMLMLLLFLALCAGTCYILYAEYWDSYIKTNYMEILKLASIPLICILFTYGHIALALEMTFWPTEFWPTPALQFKSGPLKGYGFGWQGIPKYIAFDCFGHKLPPQMLS